MSKYKKISEARKILELPETATAAMIKSNYRRLLAAWHPDKCKEDRDTSAEMTRRIILAYQTINDYCSTYKYYFSEDTVKEHLTPEEWWTDRFGDDPLWGKGNSEQ